MGRRKRIQAKQAKFSADTLCKTHHTTPTTCCLHAGIRPRPATHCLHVCLTDSCMTLHGREQNPAHNTHHLLPVFFVYAVLVTDVNRSLWTGKPLWPVENLPEGRGFLSWLLPWGIRKYVSCTQMHACKILLPYCCPSDHEQL